MTDTSYQRRVEFCNFLFSRYTRRIAQYFSYQGMIMKYLNVLSQSLYLYTDVATTGFVFRIPSN